MSADYEIETSMDDIESDKTYYIKHTFNDKPEYIKIKGEVVQNLGRLIKSSNNSESIQIPIEKIIEFIAGPAPTSLHPREPLDSVIMKDLLNERAVGPQNFLVYKKLDDRVGGYKKRTKKSKSKKSKSKKSKSKKSKIKRRKTRRNRRR
tara:strand:- start:178 stop:624 length:447 start_codon:yes stop_codon:yes gene_type:complete